MKRMTVLFGACLTALLVQSAMAQQPQASSPAMSSEAAAKPSAAMMQVHAACADDVKKLCPDAQPGTQAMHTCLRQHTQDLSTGCKQAVKAAHQGQHPEQQPQSSQAPKTQ